jgi:hypothetical protein
MAIPGDFGLNFNVPLWHNNIASYDNTRLLELIVERRIKNQSFYRIIKRPKMPLGLKKIFLPGPILVCKPWLS